MVSFPRLIEALLGAQGMLIIPKRVMLDSAHLGDLVRDINSKNARVRDDAKLFVEQFMDSGSILVLTYHHLEELLRHKDIAVAEERLRFLASLPFVATLKSITIPFAGDVLDVLCKEVAASIASTKPSLTSVKLDVSQSLFEYGSGTTAIAPVLEVWPEIRPFWQEQEIKAREVAAIAYSKTFDLSARRVDEFLAGSVRRADAADLILKQMKRTLTADIQNKGDRRLENPRSIASNFLDKVVEEGRSYFTDEGNFGLELLRDMGILAGDIAPNTTVGEIGELAIFRKRLQQVCRLIGADWELAKVKAQPDILPSNYIQNCILRYGQDPQRRNGSELNDRYLVSLAPYVDLVLVDKRTKNNFMQAERKCPELSSLVGKIERVANFREISGHLHS